MKTKEIIKVAHRLADPFRVSKGKDSRLEDVDPNDTLEFTKEADNYLARNGIVVRKFFLHVSKKEQKRRFLERIDDGQKNWKFSSNDAAERDFWDDYMKAYEEMIRQTATQEAPWYVVPADNKWFARLVMSTVIIDVLDRLDLEFPKFDRPALRGMRRMRKTLEAE